jgi:uncharacterized repeat protein (TIGR03809 family)
MAARDCSSTQQSTAQRWRDLAERRRQHIVDLYETGRWRHYYSETELLDAMREAIRNVATWDEILKSGEAAAAALPDDPEAALKELQKLVGDETAPPGSAEPDAA